MNPVDIFTFFGVILPVLSQFDAMLIAIDWHRHFSSYPMQTVWRFR